MGLELARRVQVGKETVRGTPVVMTLELPLVGGGIKPDIQAPVGEVWSSATWPYLTGAVPLG